MIGYDLTVESYVKKYKGLGVVGYFGLTLKYIKFR